MTVLTVYPADGTGDLGVYSQNANFATARAATVGTGTSAIDGYSYARLVATDYYIGRTFYTFDTSSLPDNAIISAAVFSAETRQKTGTGTGRSYNVYSSTHSDTPVSEDFDLAGTTEYSTAKTQDGIAAAGNTYNDFTFNAAGIAAISKTGLTKICTREVQKDVGNSAPTDDVYMTFRLSNDTAGTDHDPKLTITYTTPASFFLMF